MTPRAQDDLLLLLARRLEKKARGLTERGTFLKTENPPDSYGFERGRFYLALSEFYCDLAEALGGERHEK